MSPEGLPRFASTKLQLSFNAVLSGTASVTPRRYPSSFQGNRSAAQLVVAMTVNTGLVSNFSPSSRRSLDHRKSDTISHLGGVLVNLAAENNEDPVRGGRLAADRVLIPAKHRRLDDLHAAGRRGGANDRLPFLCFCGSNNSEVLASKELSNP